MRITSSYGMKLTGDLTALETSSRVYRQALSFIIPIINDDWETLSQCEHTNQKYNLIEKWIHTTSKNQARFDFDEQFPKFPTYLRRSAIAKALGIVSSYRSNLKNWEEEPKGQAPKLSLNHYAYPAYYKGNLFRNFDPVRQTIELKVFKNGDWVYEVYQLKTSDCTYYQTHLTGKKQNVPVIQKKGRRFYATFSYEEETVLAPEDSIRKVCAVDLGLGTDATCSIMDEDGTVYARKFISFSKEHDRLDTQLGRIKNKRKPEMYDEWLKHPNALVRRGLAEQGYYPEILIKDKNPKVRYAVATKHLEYFPELLKRKADYKLAWAYIAEHASKINSETYNTILNTTPPANLTKNHQLALKLKKQETSEEVSLLQKTMTTEQLFDMGILESVKELSLYTLLLLANAREIVKTQQLTGFHKAVDKCVKQGNLNIFDYPYKYEKDELHDEATHLLQYVGVLQ